MERNLGCNHPLLVVIISSLDVISILSSPFRKLEKDMRIITSFIAANCPVTIAQSPSRTEKL